MIKLSFFTLIAALILFIVLLSQVFVIGLNEETYSIFADQSDLSDFAS